MSPDELTRIRQTYAARMDAAAHDTRYSNFNESYLFAWQQRQRDVLTLLRTLNCTQLHSKRVLEIGCGAGGVLLEYLSYGVAGDKLFGVDLMPSLLRRAAHRLPHIALACADGQSLPYAAQTFDLVLQYTMFSSILDAQVKANIAREMLRVLKPDGMIIWYDFWLNPANRATRGIPLREVRALFPSCRLLWRRITLAPPITRRLVRVSWLLCALLEKLRLFNSHLLVAIRPPIADGRTMR
jgi:SAM-dependent methyltransferase